MTQRAGKRVYRERLERPMRLIRRMRWNEEQAAGTGSLLALLHKVQVLTLRTHIFSRYDPEMAFMVCFDTSSAHFAA